MSHFLSVIIPSYNRIELGNGIRLDHGSTLSTPLEPSLVAMP